MLLQEQMRITEQQREIFALREKLQNAQDQIAVLEDLRTVDLAKIGELQSLLNRAYKVCVGLTVQVQSDHESEAERRSIDAGLGVSEWSGFMPDAWGLGLGLVDELAAILEVQSG